MSQGGLIAGGDPSGADAGGQILTPIVENDTEGRTRAGHHRGPNGRRIRASTSRARATALSIRASPSGCAVGLHTGEAIKEGEDFFGKTVILAARIASQALGGQILVSSLLKALVDSGGEFEFGDAQNVELKGLTGLHQLHQVL